MFLAEMFLAMTASRSDKACGRRSQRTQKDDLPRHGVEGQAAVYLKIPG
jgi:hypothetical protein